MSNESRYSSDTAYLTSLATNSFYMQPDPFLKDVAEQELLHRTTLHKEIRSYEVSLWTLQDEFITVLKWSDLSQQAGIQEAKMVLNVDGTQTFNFSIPMYLYQEVQKIYNSDYDTKHPLMELQENPIWYNTRNGNLITDTRKIKVIFNKGISDLEEVYEFLIIKVNEDHDSDQLTCKVECESLAFHELGKVGYKYSLSAEEFLVSNDEWCENGYWYKTDGTKVTSQPKETVQYWCELCRLKPWPSDTLASLDPTEWYYDIQMDWGAFEQNDSRLPTHVYEESYVTSWKIDSDKSMSPVTVEPYKEKERPVNVSESNLYNITQAIAEAFEIHCKYKYIYDDNYHIIARVVIFFNNYFKEEDGIFSFTYPYSSHSISREMDSTDLTTKMFVRPELDETTLEGEINIMYCDANKSKEDYLLNFDYLHDIGAISEEQYQEIAPYEIKMRRYNDELYLLSLELAYYDDMQIEKNAKKTTCNESISIDLEQIDYNKELYNKLDEADGQADGYFTRDKNNPYSTYVHVRENGESFITFNTQDKGIKESSIEIYKSYNSATKVLSNQITSGYHMDRDEFGDINRISFDSEYTDNVKTIYLIYKYQPKLYYEAVIKIWERKAMNDQIELERLNQELEQLETNITAAKEIQKTKQQEKAEEVRKFERLMGPALREGYWQPDDYNDYGEPKEFWSNSFDQLYNERKLIPNTGTEMILGWDANLLETEDKIYFTSGVNEDRCYYPCIDLTNHMEYLQGRLSSSSKLSFIFNNNYYKALIDGEANNIKNIGNFTLGSGAILGFLASSENNLVKPILILTGAKDMTDEQISFMLNPDNDKGHPRLGILKVTLDANNQPQISLTDTTTISLDEIYWEKDKYKGTNAELGLNDFNNTYITYTQIQPRIKCSNSRLKTDINNLYIEYAGDPITKFDDFSVITRVTYREDTDHITRAYPEYFITLKPEMMMNKGTYKGSVKIKYRLSNAIISIYRDAQKILVENAYPKVSYEIAANIVTSSLLQTLYRSLFQLVTINDTQLKFEHVFGYISQVELNLDKPWEDVIQVKNYKTKFEDLFSNIVAQTEEMARSSDKIIAAAKGGIPLTADAFKTTLASHYNTFAAYMDSHFDNSDIVERKLNQIMTEAGKILSNSKHSIEDITNLTLENANILSGFLENVATGLIPTVFNSRTQPIVFKTGDIWNQLDANGNIIGRYVATADSKSGIGGFTRTFDGSLASITGASLEVDAVEGTVNILAQNRIDMKSGGNIYIAANENVDILGNKAVNIGGTRINMASCGGSIEQSGIALISSADDTNPDKALERSYIINLIEPYRDQKDANNNIIEIYNNPKFQTIIKSLFNFYINREGNRIYYLQLNSNTRLEFESSDRVGSIENINYAAVFSVLNNKLVNTNISKVVIYPKRIDMTSASIYMKGSSKILAIATNATNATGVSAVSIDAYDGVWIGANHGVRFYGGNELNYNEADRTLTPPSKGASVELNSEHLILGFARINAEDSEVSNASAIELTEEYVIIAKGNILKDKTLAQKQLLNVTGKTTGLVGAKFTNKSIGLAIEYDDENNNKAINAILMDNNGVTIGSGNIDISLTSMNPNTTDGSYVRIASTGIEIGTLGNLYLNTNNIKLQSNETYKTRFAIGYNLQNVNTDNIINFTNTIHQGNNIEPEDEYIVNLVQNEHGLFIRGTIYADKFMAASDYGYFTADSIKLGFYDNTNNALMTFDSEGNLTVYKDLTITTGKNLIIHANPDSNQSSRFIVDTGAVGSDNIFYAANSATWPYATHGIKFNLDDGLTLKGDVTANTFTAYTNIDSAVQYIFKVDSNSLGFYSLDNTLGANTITSILTIDNEGKISAGADLVLDAEKNLYIDTQNFFLDSSSEGNIFILKRQVENGYESCLTFNAASGLIINGSLTAIDGTIGGWTIQDHWLYSENASGNVYLNSDEDEYEYAIDVNGNFLVKFDGTVYLNKLIICGEEVDLSSGASSFDNAVSLSGEWDGTDFVVSACFFNNSKLTKSQSMTASFAIDEVYHIVGSQDGHGWKGVSNVVVTTTIDGEESPKFTVENVVINADEAYQDGWKDARKLIEPRTLNGSEKEITIPSENYYSSSERIQLTPVFNKGWNECYAKCTSTSTRAYTIRNGDGATEHFVKDSSSTTGYSTVGDGWYQLSVGTYYTLVGVGTKT